MKHVIITTSSTIEGSTISEYIDVVQVCMVVGTDLSLTSLLSSPAGRYRDTVNEVYSKAMSLLKMRGRALNADAIIALQSDLEEISNRGKLRFVLSLMGTAVHLDKACPGDKRQESVDLFELERCAKLQYIAEKLRNKKYMPNEDEWEDILNYGLYDFAPTLYHRYLLSNRNILRDSYFTKNLIMNDCIVPFLKSMGYEAAAEVVYADFTTNPHTTHEVVKRCNLFHPERIVKMLTPQNKHLVISLLDCDKERYTKHDLELMKQIVQYLDNLPDTGHYETGHSKLFGKSGIVLVCERGHTSAVELGGHCTETIERGMGICNLNVKGITEAEVATINAFKQKVLTLQSLLDNQQ